VTPSVWVKDKNFVKPKSAAALKAAIAVGPVAVNVEADSEIF